MGKTNTKDKTIDLIIEAEKTAKESIKAAYDGLARKETGDLTINEILKVHKSKIITSIKEIDSISKRDGFPKIKDDEKATYELRISDLKKEIFKYSIELSFEPIIKLLWEEKITLKEIFDFKLSLYDSKDGRPHKPGEEPPVETSPDGKLIVRNIGETNLSHKEAVKIILNHDHNILGCIREKQKDVLENTKEIASQEIVLKLLGSFKTFLDGAAKDPEAHKKNLASIESLVQFLLEQNVILPETGKFDKIDMSLLDEGKNKYFASGQKKNLEQAKEDYQTLLSANDYIKIALKRSVEGHKFGRLKLKKAGNSSFNLNKSSDTIPNDGSKNSNREDEFCWNEACDKMVDQKFNELSNGKEGEKGVEIQITKMEQTIRKAEEERAAFLQEISNYSKTSFEKATKTGLTDTKTNTPEDSLKKIWGCFDIQISILVDSYKDFESEIEKYEESYKEAITEAIKNSKENATKDLINHTYEKLSQESGFEGLSDLDLIRFRGEIYTKSTKAGIQKDAVLQFMREAETSHFKIHNEGNLKLEAHLFVARFYKDTIDGLEDENETLQALANKAIVDLKNSVDDASKISLKSNPYINGSIALLVRYIESSKTIPTWNKNNQTFETIEKLVNDNLPPKKEEWHKKWYKDQKALDEKQATLNTQRSEFRENFKKLKKSKDRVYWNQQCTDALDQLFEKISKASEKQNAWSEDCTKYFGKLEATVTEANKNRAWSDDENKLFENFFKEEQKNNNSIGKAKSAPEVRRKTIQVDSAPKVALQKETTAKNPAKNPAKKDSNPVSNVSLEKQKSTTELEKESLKSEKEPKTEGKAEKEGKNSESDKPKEGLSEKKDTNTDLSIPVNTDQITEQEQKGTDKGQTQPVSNLSIGESPFEKTLNFHEREVSKNSRGEGNKTSNTAKKEEKSTISPPLLPESEGNKTDQPVDNPPKVNAAGKKPSKTSINPEGATESKKENKNTNTPQKEKSKFAKLLESLPEQEHNSVRKKAICDIADTISTLTPKQISDDISNKAKPLPEHDKARIVKKLAHNLPNAPLTQEKKLENQLGKLNDVINLANTANAPGKFVKNINSTLYNKGNFIDLASSKSHLTSSKQGDHTFSNLEKRVIGGSSFLTKNKLNGLTNDVEIGKAFKDEQNAKIDKIRQNAKTYVKADNHERVDKETGNLLYVWDNPNYRGKEEHQMTHVVDPTTREIIGYECGKLASGTFLDRPTENSNAKIKVIDKGKEIALKTREQNMGMSL